ncbi:MAG: putative peptidyl-prolyl cis-trans isomerase [Candidatus Omnitrophica bacterium ADurb.Bin277]|nr:MAG: putative peptidyl-prolyl cis-trans isomerase [Candidatus Omnitrophica bacterium ADurb.Bin277]
MKREMLSFVVITALISLLQGCASQSKAGNLAATGAGTAVQAVSATAEASAPAAALPTQTTTASAAAERKETMKATIQTTKGMIEVELYADKAPKTVENFVTLAQKGFYDGIIFHRVIPGFMIQTGDPTGTGMGGPGYKFADEFDKSLRHNKPGVLSMANSGPNTNGSQFFICEVPTPWLDDKHSVFGRVTSGMDVVTRIANAPRDGRDKPLETIKMEKVTILD